MTRAIIPCAGFGTRMNMPQDRSKEMLFIPGTHKHLIDNSINLCEQYELEPIFITRAEKTDLKSYLTIKGLEHFDIVPEGEWNDTVLKSKEYWAENNILILPDTIFSPTEAILQIQLSLKLGNQAVFGVHEVSDPENWGIIDRYTITDKPQSIRGKQWAWGIIGFKSFFGEELFTNMTKIKPIPHCGFTSLDSFTDLTREPWPS